MPLHFSTILVAAFAGVSAVTSAPAAAQEEASSPLTVSGEVGIVSDYRFRGISLANRKPAVQGGLTLEHGSGAYAGVWGSTIAESESGADVEVDLFAGYSAELDSGLGLDLMVTYYAYPGDGDLNYLEGYSTLSYTLGPATPKLGIAYAPKQKALQDEFGADRDNLYAFTGLDVALPGTPVTLSGQLGYETGAFDAREGGGKWDWQIGGSLAVSAVTLGLSYVGSNAHVPDDDGDNLAGDTVVASLLLNF